MKLRQAALLASFLILSMFTQWEAHRLLSEAPQFALAGRTAPSIELLDLAGDRMELVDFRGRLVVLGFWTTSCASCQWSIQALERLAGRLGDRIVLLSVNLRENRDVVRDFVERNQLHSRVLLDTDGEAARDYRLRAIPTLFLIDRDGIVKEVVVGYGPLSLVGIRTWIESEERFVGSADAVW